MTDETPRERIVRRLSVGCALLAVIPFITGDALDIPMLSAIAYALAFAAAAIMLVGELWDHWEHRRSRARRGE